MGSSDGEAGQIGGRSWSLLLANDVQFVGNTHLFKPQLDQALSAGYITGNNSEATVGSS